VTLAALAIALGAFSVILVWPAAVLLARATWVARCPRAAVCLWQSIGLGAASAGIGAGLCLAVMRYHAGFVAGVTDLTEGLTGGHPLRGLGLANALGLTLAADLLIVVGAVLMTVIVGAARARERHRRLLDLLATTSSAYPGTDLLCEERAVAYCLPGRHPRIVISEGTKRLLTSGQLAAVIEHERGHIHAHHGLVLLPMDALRKVFGWIPYARLAPREIAALLEMSADDYSSRRNDPFQLAAALVEMVTSGGPPMCSLAVAREAVPARVNRLLAVSRTSKTTAATTALLAASILSIPLVLVLST
jgi:Zn-dependent protease with chaperone function